MIENISNSVEKNNDNNKQEIDLKESNYDYKNYKIVRLLHVKDNNVEEISLDEYLYGVVASEMPADFEVEALKAQAVVARTYTIYKIQNNNRKT